MNRNLVFGAGLAAVLVGATLVLTGGTATSPAPTQVPTQGKPLPSLAPMLEADPKPAPPEAKSTPAPAAPQH